jgi:hypothetical protein
MKISELLHRQIKEAADYRGGQGLRKDAFDSLPNAHVYPGLDNSSGYLAYRFGVALAGMPDQKMDVAGPTGLKMVSIGYTPAEEEILNAAAGLVGTPKVRLTSDRSEESPGTNKASPIKGAPKFTRGK